MWHLESTLVYVMCVLRVVYIWCVLVYSVCVGEVYMCVYGGMTV